MGLICKFKECSKECEIFSSCTSDKRLEFGMYKKTKRFLWDDYRRFAH